MSESEAFSTPTTCTLPVSTIWRSLPSRDLTESVLPSSFSIVPRTRAVCCADADDMTHAAASAARARIGNAFLRMCFLLEIECRTGYARRSGLLDLSPAGRGRPRSGRVRGERLHCRDSLPPHPDPLPDGERESRR